MLQPNRAFSADEFYRYGFNGKEVDNEVKGEGAQYDYGFRVYDPRLVKFLSIDPLQSSYPELTPYQFASNSPIQAVDLDGREIYHYLLLDGADGKPVLKYQGVQTREFASWEWVDNKSPATKFGSANGASIETKTIRVWFAGDGPNFLGEIGSNTAAVDFASFLDLMKWRDAGFPTADPTPVSTESAEQADAAMTILVNEMYFRYDMSDGHFMNNGSDGLPDISKLFEVGKSSPKSTTNKQTTAANNGNASAAKANTAEREVPPPTEAYDRLKHYGKTPTSTDRKVLGATSGQDIDHTIPLVKHYYDGDGTPGCKPGYTNTPAQRRQFATDKTNMKIKPSSQNKSEGAKLSQYSKDKKKQYGLNSTSNKKKKKT